jgi:hypothetical protein
MRRHQDTLNALHLLGYEVMLTVRGEGIGIGRSVSGSAWITAAGALRRIRADGRFGYRGGVVKEGL